MTDQQRADHTGFGGNEILRTPTLDGLAARSMIFERAYVANPICQPNRCSILTMRYPSVHGTRHNGIALDWRANTFVRRLRSDGYRTGLVGKGHFQNFGLYPDIARQQFDLSLDEQAIDDGMPHGWDHYEHVGRHLDGDVEFPDDHYGFDHVEIVSAHGDECSGHYAAWLRQQGYEWRALTPEARITRYQNLESGEMYDMSADPDELENRWHDGAAAGLRRDMSDALAEMMIACANPSLRPDYIA